MKITDVKCHVTTMGGSWLTETTVANPMSIYPEYAAKRSSWYQKMTAAVVEVILEDGTSGYGFAGGAKGGAVASVIDEQLRALVIGKTVFQTELIQEQLSRASVFYGRGGLAQCAISAIDIALWDAKGKVVGQPVYNLLGGKTRETLKTYYTGNDPTALREFGIKDMKIAMPYGPADGESGMRKNEAAVALARETLGPDAFIALDLYMAWDVPYTLKMYERVRQYKIAWLEEPVQPDDYEGYATIRRRVDTMVTGGEHEYTLEGFRRLIESGCVDIVQPDIYRAGGPTALKKIAVLAKANHIKLICHGIGSPTYHFEISNGPELTPFVEYIDIYLHATRDWVLSDDPRPIDGELILENKPGFGYGLNSAVFDENHQGQACDAYLVVQSVLPKGVEGMVSFHRGQMERVIQGVIPILPTPFFEGGEMDMGSFLSAIDTAIGHKAAGVAMFGLASEYYKLSDAERFGCITALVHQVAGRVPAIISIVAHATEVAVKDAKFAEQEGADAIMVLPPFFLAPDADSVRRHILEVASAVSLPVIIQYAPAQTGYPIPADSFAQLRQDAPNIACIKVDQVPAGAMVRELQKLGMDSVVGYMGLNLPHDYECGAVGVMPTVSVCPGFAEIWTLLMSQDPSALVLHDTLVPLLKFMMRSIECLIASEKQLLKDRGVIRSKYCRRPSYRLDPTEQAELAEYASRVAPWLVGGNEGI